MSVIAANPSLVNPSDPIQSKNPTQSKKMTTILQQWRIKPPPTLETETIRMFELGAKGQPTAPTVSIQLTKQPLEPEFDGQLDELIILYSYVGDESEMDEKAQQLALAEFPSWDYRDCWMHEEDPDPF